MSLARKPRVVILHVPGSNRDRSVARACDLAGGESTIVVASSDAGENLAAQAIDRAQMVVLPGGFSFGDALGAGRLLAQRLIPGRSAIGDAFARAVGRDVAVLGICNGFQALVKSGWLPGEAEGRGQPEVTLTHNAQREFVCRWVRMRVEANACVFLQGVDSISCPTAHGEGRFVGDDSAIDRIEALGHVALRYVDDGHRDWSSNPNGSCRSIAGLTNRRGTILGLMPHPEDHVHRLQSPRRFGADRHRGHHRSALALFEAGIRHARSI